MKTDGLGIATELNIPNNNQKEDKVKLSLLIQRMIKRIFDLLFGIIGVILLIPIALIIFIVRKIKKEDDGPIFYEQLRIGKNGKYFRLYKFRTMVVGADDILKEYLEKNEEARKEFEENQKLINDPRVTKLGKFLRETSLDEVPQFINVLKGEMSLIGPRPIVDREVKLFGDKWKIVNSVKPGITGMWASSGRSDITYQERVEKEAYYAENFSLKLDFEIFFRTIVNVLKRKGAV